VDSHLAAREELKVDGADVGRGCFHRGRRNGGAGASWVREGGGGGREGSGLAASPKKGTT
jgi:hypothetical protein